ncbi:hypothetical protein CTI14_50385, partial [Methylobacterium radiotolerans]
MIVNKDRFVAGSVEIGKHVETRQESVQVPLQREEVVIERHTVSDARPVERVLRAANPQYAMDEQSYTRDRGYRSDDALYQTPDRLQLLEERLIVNKDRFVAGSVEIGKHVETRQESVQVP